MGTKERPKAERLAGKLLAIRKSLGLSQNEMLDALALKEITVRSTISAFERGTREPSYPALLRYARIAGVTTDELIDDQTDLNLTTSK